MLKGLYKEYQYKKGDSALRVYIPKYYKNKIKGIKNLWSAMYWGETIKVSEEDSCISIIPWGLFANCANLTVADSPQTISCAIYSAKYTWFTLSEIYRQILDEIDLLLNPIGFYR